MGDDGTCDANETGVGCSTDERGKGVSANGKRQRVLQLATQLACEEQEGERREALIQLLMHETKDPGRLANAMRFPQWRLHGDGDGAASDVSANGSVETEELPSPSQNE